MARPVHGAVALLGVGLASSRFGWCGDAGTRREATSRWPASAASAFDLTLPAGAPARAGPRLGRAARRRAVEHARAARALRARPDDARRGRAVRVARRLLPREGVAAAAGSRGRSAGSPSSARPRARELRLTRAPAGRPRVPTAAARCRRSTTRRRRPPLGQRRRPRSSDALAAIAPPKREWLARARRAPRRARWRELLGVLRCRRGAPPSAFSGYILGSPSRRSTPRSSATSRASSRRRRIAIRSARSCSSARASARARGCARTCTTSSSAARSGSSRRRARARAARGSGAGRDHGRSSCPREPRPRGPARRATRRRPATRWRDTARRGFSLPSRWRCAAGRERRSRPRSSSSPSSRRRRRRPFCSSSCRSAGARRRPGPR